MNKTQLVEYLQQHFSLVIVNDKFKCPIKADEIRLRLDIPNGSIDDKCVVNVADVIAKNEKNQIFYFLYYSQKENLVIFDSVKKCIDIRMKNNVMKRYQYNNVMKAVKKHLYKSNTYVIFFSCGEVEFNEPLKSHILVLNEHNLDLYLDNKYDNLNDFKLFNF